MIKALFFDIDGTLVCFRTHSIPASTIEALERAKAAEVKVFIATGRPVPFIDNLGAVEHLIDGYVTTNGAFCFVNKEVILRKVIPQEAVRKMACFSAAEGFACVYVGERNIVLQNPNDTLRDIFYNRLKVKTQDESLPLELVFSDNIIQMSPIVPEDEGNRMMKELTECISGRWHPAFMDVTAKEADKGEGLKTMAAHFGIKPEETMAFGDGGNDTAMIRCAGVGVAMGNAIENLKSEADYVTASVDEDGVRQALLHWHVI